MTEVKEGHFVMIGDFIAGAEEYVYEDPSRIHEIDGKLYASISGKIHIDPVKRTINVENDKIESREVKPGDLVVGQVEFMRRYTVGLRIYIINDRHIFDGSLYGNIHISNISKQYTEKVEEAYKKTDIVRARVVEQWNDEFELTTDAPDLGVISCSCNICGTTMKRTGRRNVECPFCGNKGLRKLSDDFLSE
ncbi:MAG: exosome complex RNA-binding protein Csl4 [Candidatus Lokiarchaeota archaeon]|nr:exosome complex RNA-binding protein Csl4 [Candidatus Lokiarchaeota archaeon]